MNKVQRAIQHLKDKWAIESNWDFVLIMIVFSLAGMNVSMGRKPLFHLLGVTARTPFAIKTFLYLLFLFPMYQISLLIYGFLLGQFGFFWKKQKQLVGFIRKKLAGKHTASSKSELR